MFQTLKDEHNIILIGISKFRQDGTRKLMKNPSNTITVSAGDYLIMIMTGENEAPITELFGVPEGYKSTS